MNSPDGSLVSDSSALPRAYALGRAGGRRPLSDLNFTSSIRRSNASLSALFAASASGISKRASSPIVGKPVSSGHGAATAPVLDGQDDCRDIILRSLVPHVAILPSTDAEELMAQKGFNGGLLELLRPYGENIAGKVTIRDSVGASRSYENYAVRFAKLGDGFETEKSETARGIDGYLDKMMPQYSASLRLGGDIDLIERTLSKRLEYADSPTSPDAVPRDDPLHKLYLCRVLSGLPLSPHETFSHPVACVIAISSRSADPIEELRNLYTSTMNGAMTMPSFASNDYLRYYVLIHDEEHDDVQRSTSLFEQMKRHFGLHCHLLRIRSTQCVPSDDDAVRLPVCEWLSAAEELCEIERREGLADMDDIGPCLYESDAAAVRSLVRELVTQSIVPSLERQCATWNDQIVSRRRGFGGRFLSLSKKWTPFGSQQGSSPSSGYNAGTGHYKLTSETALLRRLGDTCMMLRDFELAHTAYDLLRNDSAGDKAWKHYAGACEMTAVSSLLSASPLSQNKSSSTSVEALLQASLYQYVTRCNAPFYALRGISIAVELLRTRGAALADDAAQWASRLIDAQLVGPIGTVLFAERAAACYSLRSGSPPRQWGSRNRKSALWSAVAAQRWLDLGEQERAGQCLEYAWTLYSPDRVGPVNKFRHIRLVMDELHASLTAQTVESSEDVDETLEQVDDAPDYATSPIEGRFSVRRPSASHETVAGKANEAKVDIRQHRHSLIDVPTNLNPPSSLTEK